MAGSHQGEQLIAGSRQAVAVKGEMLQGLVEGRTRGGLDVEMVGRGGLFRLAFFHERLDDDGNLAELEQVAFLQGPLPGPQTYTIQARTVGAAEVAHAPAAFGDADLGVIAADGVIVENDLERIEP